ncbi:MAG: hypothetical protein ACR2KV_06400 [Solirubrobacteraceae bacterium]
MTSFMAEAHQNEYLPPGASTVGAIVTVTAAGGGDVDRVAPMAAGAGAAEIVIVDTSKSMDVPRTKIRAAREATAVAIDCIRDGVAFGVIAGTNRASDVYPRTGRLAISSPATRDQARAEVSRLSASGGTAIGSWLRRAGELFAAAPPGVHHAILLTDGENEHETPAELDDALAALEGRFQCDCRGVGTDWELSELRRVASALLGSVDIIADPSAMVADFRAMTETAMGRATGDVSLRLWTPRGATVAFVRQVAPTIEDLTDRARPVDALTADYPTGAWGEEARDYHVGIEVDPRGIGEEMLAARVGLVVGGEVCSQALVRAIWTDDEERSTAINREVAHYTGQAELAEAIQEGLEARRAGDAGTATLRLGRAVALASEGGNDATLKLLAAVVEVDDPVAGTVRLRPAVTEADEMTLDTRSTKTVRVRPGPS